MSGFLEAVFRGRGADVLDAAFYPCGRDRPADVRLAGDFPRGAAPIALAEPPRHVCACPLKPGACTCPVLAVHEGAALWE